MDVTKLTEDLIRDEGLKTEPYVCTAGKLTIGVGRNLADGISKAEALFLLSNDILAVTRELDKAIPWWLTLSEPRRRALANMAFNMGVPRLLGFKNMLAAMERGDFARAAAEALDSQWACQVGERAKRIAALIREG